MSERQTPARARSLLMWLRLGAWRTAWRTAWSHLWQPVQRLGRCASRWLRSCFWPLMVVYFLLAGLLLGLRYWVLPQISQHTPAIERLVSQAVGERVSIGRIEAGWHGLHPELQLSEVRIFDREGRAVLTLPGIEANIAWSSLLRGTVDFHSLLIDRPDLDIRRDSNGRISVAGLLLQQDDSANNGFLQWLLAQREIVVRDAQLVWEDEQRGAPPLRLGNVNLVLNNTGALHRFALRASSDPELASTLDLRGELRGTLQDGVQRALQHWTGRLYAELGYTDLAAWQRWVDYPFELAAGKGGVRVWLGFAGQQLNELAADLALGGVSARLRPDLPWMELDYLQGHVAGKRSAAAGYRNAVGNVVSNTAVGGMAAGMAAVVDAVGGAVGGVMGGGTGSTSAGRRKAAAALAAPGSVATGTVYDLDGRNFALRTRDGVSLPGFDFNLRWQDVQTQPEQDLGTLSATSLQLGPLLRVTEFLPLPAALRSTLTGAAPQGALNDVQLAWRGGLQHPQQYQLRARFEQLAAKLSAGLPGFAGLSGSLEANEQGGLLKLDSSAAMLDIPDVLPAGGVAVDSLSGRLGWTLASPALTIRLEDLKAANEELAIALSGSYELRAGRSGVIDLTASIPRGQAVAVSRYIPGIGGALREYLQGAIQAGAVKDGKLRLKGDLARFPFSKPADGQFLIEAQLAQVDFRFDERWPALEAVDGSIRFSGPGMEIRSRAGRILGARMGAVVASVPDLFQNNPQLRVEGQVDGPTQEFLRYLELSPVSGWIGRFTEGARGSGDGRLTLRLGIPLAKTEATTVAGGMQFLGSQIQLDPDMPAFAQINGRLDFTERSVTARGIQTQLLGGSATVGVQTRADGAIQVSAQGNAATRELRRLLDMPQLARLSGTLPWRGNLLVRRGAYELTLDSDLRGVAIDLPAPLGKAANEVMPLRIERTNASDAETLKRFGNARLPARGDLTTLAIGRAPGQINLLLPRQRDGQRWLMERLSVGLNEAPQWPLAAAGIQVNGTLPALDVNRWLSVMDDAPGAVTASTATATSAGATPAVALPSLSALNLRVGTLDVIGKRLHEVVLRANAVSAAVPPAAAPAVTANASSSWTAQLSAREVEGMLTWRPEGRGRVVARLKRLQIPDNTPPGEGTARPESQRELPALDVVTEDLVLRNKKLGRLELQAVNQGRDWRLEKLLLSNSDGQLQLDGIWQSWASKPSIVTNLKLEVSDSGQFLARFGMADTVKGGSAKIEGRLGWAGGPQVIDYPTLTGNVSLQAEKGQFLKADPGIAKLLGVLSLQSLITLDVRDLFREGFSYESLNATAAISKGVLTTSDFNMKGSAAAVSLNGTIDLAGETQNLRMRVVPSVGEGVATLAGVALANPLIGIPLSLLQRFLQNPIGQIFALDYNVTGSWAEPKVERVRADLRPNDVNPR